jgi:adenylate cyclase
VPRWQLASAFAMLRANQNKRKPMPALNRKHLYQLLLVLLVSTVISGVHWVGGFDRFENIGFDIRAKFFRGDTVLPDKVAVVLIDEASVQALNPLVGRYPWPRAIYADLMEFFAAGGARAVMFDILFTENERRIGDERVSITPSDQRLIEGTEEFEIAVHAAQLISDREDEANKDLLNKPLPALFRERFALPKVSGLPASTNNNFLIPYDGLYQASPGVGIVGVDPDPDGVYRRLKLLHGYHGDWFPGLSVAGLLDLLAVERVSLADNRLRLGNVTVPVDDQQQYLINMYGNYRPYSISGIFASLQKIRSGEVEGLRIFPDEFEDKIVFVGASAVGLEDVKSTSVAGKTPGVLLHASVAANMLTQDFLTIVPKWVTILLIVAFSACTGLAIFYVSGFWLQVMLPMLIAGGYAGISFWQFGANLVYDIVPPVTAVVWTWLLAFAYLSFTEGKDRRRVHKMFSQYVNEAVLDEVMENYEDILHARVGKREKLTVLFSDIRGFTTISESLQPEQVVELLNIHFDTMTNVIFDYKGTLDKFIGDAIMAFWGAPVRVEDHALLAFKAAVEMVAGLETVNAKLLERGYPTVSVGIGLHTGEVILGNIGSERKLDYTVIGDNVNLASRLEGLTKQYGFPLVVSESTMLEAASGVPHAILDQVRVKGKSQGVKIYAPLLAGVAGSGESAALAEEAELIGAAFEDYLAQRWDAAIEKYAQIGCGRLREIYTERCANLKEMGVSHNWDGIYSLSTK